MGIEVIGTVHDGVLFVRVPSLPDGTTLQGELSVLTRPKMAHEMTEEEFRLWFSDIVRDGFEIEEPPDPPPEPVEEW